MIDKIKKFYLSKTLFIVSSALAVLCYLFDAVWATINGQESYYAWILLALIVMLQWSFFAGQINMQKMLFGSLLLYMFVEQIELFKLDMSYTGKVSIMDVFLIIMAAATFVAHMYQQMDHKGKSFAGMINQLLGITMLLFICTAFANLIVAPAYFQYYVFLFGYGFNCILVICMETRVEKYKQIRDKFRNEGNWTEENRREAKKLFKLI